MVIAVAPNPNLQLLRDAGVSVWLDTLSRELLDGGGFAELIRDWGVTGATSNPAIFAQAITSSDCYDGQLRKLVAAGERDPRELFFSLALDDIRAAARLLRPAYEGSSGRDGFVSFECTPDLADDTEATIAQATSLWHRLDQPNVMIKVPGTAAGEPMGQVASVASFFLSRIDTKADAQLDNDSPLRGRLAIASGRVAYQ